MEAIKIDYLNQAKQNVTSTYEEEEKINDYDRYRKVFPITIVLSNEDLEFFNEYCHKNYLKRSYVARQVLKDFFDNFKG